MTARELASIMRARKCGRYWMARCVVHDDRAPSVSIRELNGKVSIHCFAGCDARDILSALNLTWKDLGYGGDPGWKKRIVTAKVKDCGTRKPLGELVATYRYVDESGKLIAEKLRFHPKTFLWRTPTPNGGWNWKIKRDSLPLYRLDEVVTAKTVYLAEGEKDADRLRSLGVTATTPPNGANSWRSEFCSIFTGKRVVLIPDTDAPGQSFAWVARKGIEPLAKSVKVVSVLPYKDVSDFLDAESPAALRKRIQETK